jgi:1-pyrroline-5-carboxylate dehydrogenase
MTTLNYTSTAADPTLDETFERALSRAREGRPAPLAHLIRDEARAVGDVFERADPCDPGRIVSRAHAAGDEIVAAAVRAARAAQREWAATPLADRTAALRRIAALIAERRVELAGVVSAETGKIRLEAVPEVQEGVDLIETYCAFMEANAGYRIPLGRLSEREDNVSVMRPYGVFAVICPFNFPFALAVGMASGALVCGNTVVMKPAEETPWSTALIAELAVEAGLPAGVLNLVHGDDVTGRALVAADVDGVAFTGSAEAGHAIARTRTPGGTGSAPTRTRGSTRRAHPWSWRRRGRRSARRSARRRTARRSTARPAAGRRTCRTAGRSGRARR